MTSDFQNRYDIDKLSSKYNDMDIL